MVSSPVVSKEAERVNYPNAQLRIYLLLGAAAMCLGIMFIGILAPLLEMHNREVEEKADKTIEEQEAAVHWASVFRDALTISASATHALEAFIIAQIKTIPPIYGSIEDRTVGQEFKRFDQVASIMNSSFLSGAVFISAPGGVVLQTYPLLPALEFQDIFTTTNEILVGDSPAMDSVVSGEAEVFGPRLINTNQHDAMWSVSVRLPIYNVSRREQHSITNFWGFSFVILDLSALLESTGFFTVMKNENFDFLLYTTTPNGTLICLHYSLSANPTAEEMQSFMETGINRPVHGPLSLWSVVIRSAKDRSKMKSGVVATVVLSVVFGSFILFGLLVLLILYYTREYEGLRYAPKMAPFAMLTIGPCQAEALWDLAPDQMAEVMNKFNQLLAEHMVEYRAYQIGQLHPYTTTYTMRSLDAAVHMSFSLIEGMQSHPVDGPLCRLLGIEGRLMVSYAIHWCTDVTVTLDSTMDGFRFEGPDIVYGGKLWAFAPPNIVTVSGPAKSFMHRMPEVSVRYLGSVFLRGVVERQDLFAITDPGSRRLREAEALAAQHTARARAVHLNNAERKPTPGTHKLKSGMDGTCSTASSHSQNAGTPSICSAFSAQPPGVQWKAGAPSQRSSHSEESSTAPTNGEVLTGDSDRIIITRHHNVNPQGTVSRRDPNCPVNGGDNPLYMPEVLSGKELNFLQPISATNTIGNMSCISDCKGGAGSAFVTGRPPTGRESYPQMVSLVNDTPQGDLVTDRLLRPDIPAWLDTALRAAFDNQAVVLDYSYDSVRVLVYFFFSSYKLLFKPLAAPERVNIYRRLVTAFGVPQQAILENLSARCTIRYLQHLEATQATMWEAQL